MTNRFFALCATNQPATATNKHVAFFLNSTATHRTLGRYDNFSRCWVNRPSKHPHHLGYNITGSTRRGNWSARLPEATGRSARILLTMSGLFAPYLCNLAARAIRLCSRLEVKSFLANAVLPNSMSKRV